MTLTGEHKTNSPYSVVIENFSSDASMCSVSDISNS